MNRRIPDWLLERYLLDELPEDRRAELRNRLEEDAEARTRLERMRAETEVFLARHPPAVMVPRILARMGTPSRSAPLRLLPVAAAGALAIALFLVVRGGGGEEGIRTKGLAPALVVHRSLGDRAERLNDGALVEEGDLVQLGYVSAGRRYGAIVSVDGSGNVFRHLPLEGELAAPLESGRTVILPHAYELDDAPDFERFFFVAADEPFPIEVVLEVARGLPAHARRLPLPRDFDQATFLLRKPGETR